MPETLLIVVTGPPGAGKTTLARKIARDLGLPLFARDDVKEILFDTLGWSDRPWSRKLGLASWHILYHAIEELLKAEQSLIVESNFYREYSTPEFAALQARYRFETIQIVCEAEPDVLIRRFRQRTRSGERHPGHVDEGNLDEFVESLSRDPWGPLAIDGRVLRVDTTDLDAVDCDGIVTAIKKSGTWAVSA